MQLFITIKDRYSAKIEIDSALIDEVVHETVMHHKEHLKVHDVEQKHVDGYKILTWLGCILIKKMEFMGSEPNEFFNHIASSLVDLLGGFLYVDCDIRLPDEDLELLLKMLHEEDHDNSDHGIWMNGLYVAFHCAVRAHYLTVDNVNAA